MSAVQLPFLGCNLFVCGQEMAGVASFAIPGKPQALRSLKQLASSVRLFQTKINGMQLEVTPDRLNMSKIC